MRNFVYIYGVIFLIAEGLSNSLLNPSFEFYYENNNVSIGQDSVGNFNGVIYNNSSNAISIAIVRRVNNLSEGWSSSICIGSVCYNQLVDSVSTVINVSDSTLCGVLAWANGSGSVEVQIDLFEIDNPNENEIVHINFNINNVGIDDNLLFKENVDLISCYPNPFNPMTTLKYKIHNLHNIDIVIKDIRGCNVRNLLSNHQANGTHQIQWDGKNNNGQKVSSGVYFFYITSDNYIGSSKVLFIE